MLRRTRDDPIDLEALYRGSRDDVYAYVAAIVRDRSLAEEVTAMAFERVLTRRARYRADRGTPRAWLFGIARNAAFDELRRLARAQPTERELTGGGEADPTAEAGVRRAALAEALARLSPDERELVALRFEAGLSHAEIAGVVGISESNAGTRLSRIVAKLREAMT